MKMTCLRGKSTALLNVCAILLMATIGSTLIGSNMGLTLIFMAGATFWMRKKTKLPAALLRPSILFMVLCVPVALQSGFGVMKVGLILAGITYLLLSLLWKKLNTILILKIPMPVATCMLLILILTTFLIMSQKLASSGISEVWKTAVFWTVICLMLIWGLRKRKITKMILLTLLIATILAPLLGITSWDRFLIPLQNNEWFDGIILSPLQGNFWKQMIILPESWDWRVLLFPLTALLSVIELNLTLQGLSNLSAKPYTKAMPELLHDLGIITILGGVLGVPLMTLSLESTVIEFLPDSKRDEGGVATCLWLVIIGLLVPLQVIMMAIPQQLLVLIPLLLLGFFFWKNLKSVYRRHQDIKLTMSIVMVCASYLLLSLVLGLLFVGWEEYDKVLIKLILILPMSCMVYNWFARK